MDATISLRTFGRRNNWFSDRLHQLPTRSCKWIVLLLGIAVLGSFTIFVTSYRQSLQPLAGSLERFRVVNDLVLQTLTAHLHVEQFLASNSAEAYALGEQTLTQTIDAIDQMLRAEQSADYFVLSRLEETSTDYLNMFRSLGSLSHNGEAAETQQMIRRELEGMGSILDQQAYEMLQRSMSTTEEIVDALSDSTSAVGIVLMLVLFILFAISLILVTAITRHNAYVLHQIRQAAQQITMEQYDTRIDVSRETNQDIIRVGMTFNRMAENLQRALRSKSAAQKQSHLQLIKLARQERKTAVLEERQRIARELHDSVKQQLFSITLSAGAAINLLQNTHEHVRMHLEHIQQAGHNAQSEMTALVQELIPVSMHDKRLEEALVAYLNPLCETHGLKFLWRVDGTNTLTIAQEHALFRAVQEAVSNVVRHSGATVLHVSINFGLITHVVVEDNGTGFVPETVPPTSSGLPMMRARLLRVGGRYELQTAPGTGTRLTIVMDLRRITLPRV